MASTVKITARLFDQAGNPYHGVVKVDLVPGSGTVGQEIITNCVHVEQRIRDGVAVFNLVPNASIADDSYYAFELHEIATDAVYAPKPRLAWRKLAVVPNHDAVLSDIVIMQPIKPIPVAPAEQLVMQAQTAAGQAVAKATAAASSASAAAASAQTASGHASAASDSAGVASAKATEAGTKASDADASKIAAASSASSASAARDAAVSAAALADAKKTAAESAQASAESARDAASASAVAASSKASVASTSATSAASSASVAGIAKTAAESAQASAESARDAASASAVTASSKASEASTSATSAASSASAASESAASAVSAASQAAGTAIEAHNIASDAHADIRLSLNSGIATLSGRVDVVENSTESPVAAGKVWTSTADGAEWANPTVSKKKSVVLFDQTFEEDTYVKINEFDGKPLSLLEFYIRVKKPASDTAYSTEPTFRYDVTFENGTLEAGAIELGTSSTKSNHYRDAFGIINGDIWQVFSNTTSVSNEWNGGQISMLGMAKVRLTSMVERKKPRFTSFYCMRSSDFFKAGQTLTIVGVMEE